ncbi:MAG: 3-isopropylmalate dehydratase small subunit [Steroidobacteraceae bacterium]
MEPLRQLRAIAAPLLRDNVDTDAIIPSREMKTVGKTGLAEGLFAGWRYRSIGGRDSDPDFVLNKPEFSGARIILAGENFGCGSSREHAVWALHEYGIRAVIAASFAPIFFSNCVRNGIAPVRMNGEAIALIASWVEQDPSGNLIGVDVEGLQVHAAGKIFDFQLTKEEHSMLTEGLDAIDLTLKASREIDDFIAADRLVRPWVYLP